jgi:uncharacterized cofD-like protein
LTLTFNSGILDPVRILRDLSSRERDWGPFWEWLKPGLGVKRWLGLAVLGTVLIGLGAALILLDINSAYPDSPLLAWLSLRFIHPWLRATLLGLIGFGVLIVAILRINRTLLEPYVRPGKPVVEAVARYRRLGRGPSIVALGGGTGLSSLLRGLKHRTGNLTAIVTVADDGGSSGKLREALGLPPPGDLRNCLAALSDDEDLLTRVFQYRFRQGEALDGHSLGNLFIAALSETTGSFEEGIKQAGRVLAIRGRVLPASLKNLSLSADISPEDDERTIRIKGESQIPEANGRILRVQLEPNDPPAFPGAINAILNADMIIIGPGSLYTSILPNLLVPDISAAIRASRAFKIFVCNVATQPGETDDYDCSLHLQAIEDHVGGGLIDLVLANDGKPADGKDTSQWVEPPARGSINAGLHVADLIDEIKPWRHDPEKLADELILLLEERTGPLELPSLDGFQGFSGHN